MRDTVVKWEYGRYGRYSSIFPAGNAFAEDENGRLFYIAGSVNERPTVTDDDNPIVTSTVKREVR